MKRGFPKVQFLLGFNVISNKNHLSYSYIVLRNGKVLRIEKVWKNTKSILTFCTVKATEQKRVGYWSFDINILEIVKQSCFNFEGCEFDDLITVRDCSYLTSTSFLSKLTSCPSPFQRLSTFHKIPLHSWCQLFKTNSPSKKKKSKNKNSNINNN